jgi:hypothetical protein
MNLQIGASNILTVSAAGLTHNSQFDIFAASVSSPQIYQSGQTTDAATNSLTVQAQGAVSTAVTNKLGGALLLTGGPGASGFAQGPVQINSPLQVNTPTSIWQASGSTITSNLNILRTQGSGGPGPTGIFWLPIQPTGVSDINVTVLASNGLTGYAKIDVNGTVAQLGTGTANIIAQAQPYYRVTASATGVNAGIIATGPYVGVVVSTPTGTYTGVSTGANYKWSMTSQINYLGGV